MSSFCGSQVNTAYQLDAVSKVLGGFELLSVELALLLISNIIISACTQASIAHWVLLLTSFLAPFEC